VRRPIVGTRVVHSMKEYDREKRYVSKRVQQVVRTEQLPCVEVEDKNNISK